MSSPVISLEIPQEVLESARLTVPDLKIEIAVTLYAQNRLALSKARELADCSLWESRRIPAARHIPPYYDETDLADDYATAQTLTAR